MWYVEEGEKDKTSRVILKSYFGMWLRRPWSTASTAALHTPAAPSRVPLSVIFVRDRYGSSFRSRSRHMYAYVCAYFLTEVVGVY